MSTLTIDPGCALVCMMAQDPICRCRCGGVNHSAARMEWQGYFCEGCDFPFGKKNIWMYGAYASTGRSSKYLSRFGKPQAMHYCWPCYSKIYVVKYDADAHESILGMARAKATVQHPAYQWPAQKVAQKKGGTE